MHSLARFRHWTGLGNNITPTKGKLEKNITPISRGQLKLNAGPESLGGSPAKTTDECLKHSSSTRVGSSFSRLFYRNFIVFLVVRSLIFMSGVVASTVE